MRRPGWAVGLALTWLLASGPPAAAGTETDISNNAVVTGTILVADDVDEYRFDVTAKSGLGINLKTDPGVFVDVGLSLVDPSGDDVDLTKAKVYRDKFRQIVVGGLTVFETGTYRLLVTAAAPCAYTLKLSTTPCPEFSATLTLPAGGEAVLPISAPAHSRLTITARTRTRSRAQPRLGELGDLDLWQAGRIERRRHRVRIRDSGDELDQSLRVRDLGGLGGRIRVEVRVRATREAERRFDTADISEITSVVAGDGEVRLTWLPTRDATSYTVFWSEQPGAADHGEAIAGVTATEFTHTGLTNGLTYHYAVAATCSVHGTRPCCAERSVSLAPDPPATLTPVAGDGLVELSWSESIGATSYRIYWSTQPGVTPATGALIDQLTGTTYTHAGLQNGETYRYVVAAVGAGGEGAVSAERAVSLTPDPPGLVSAQAGDASVTVEWSDAFGATSYNLYRSTTDPATRTTGERFEGATSPYVDSTTVNGVFYYYVVTAVGPGGESVESAQVAARPLPAAEAPSDLTVTTTEESPGSLTLTWSEPPSGADSYTVYWSTTPGVGVGTNPVPSSGSPYVATGLAGRTTYYFIVTATLFGVESEPSAEVSGTPRGPPHGGGGHDGGLGNNLSFPVVFADGYGISGVRLGTDPTPWLDTATGLRPSADERPTSYPHFDAGSAIVRNASTYYPQKSASTWQADWIDGSASTQDVVVDWGDSLRSRSFRTSSVIRVETVLYQDSGDPQDTLTAFAMQSLSGSGRSEVQGTTGATYESTLRTVYSVHPRLLIEKLTGKGGDVDASVPGVDLSVAEKYGTDGPGTYGAEVNVAGKLIYGFVWQLRSQSLTEAQKRGFWRITFRLEPLVAIGADVVPRNTRIIGVDESDAADGAMADPAGVSSWIEIEVD